MCGALAAIPSARIAFARVPPMIKLNSESRVCLRVSGLMTDYVLGIDVGIRNLGLCAFDLRTGRVAHWARVPLLPANHPIRAGRLPTYVQQFLTSHAALFEHASKIVIEHQLRGLMKSLEQMLHLKFFERVLIVQPRALKAHYGCATGNYEQNKRAAERWARGLVAAEPELFEPVALESFVSEAKQDDMADALMLVCFFRDTYVL